MIDLLIDPSLAAATGNPSRDAWGLSDRINRLMAQ